MIDKRLRVGFGGAGHVWIHGRVMTLEGVDFNATWKLFLGFESVLGVE